MSPASPLSQRALLAALAILLAAIGVVLLSHPAPQATAPTPSAFAGPALPPGLRAMGFSLSDQDGRPVTLRQFRGKVVVLTFLHSLCHDACPLMAEQIKGALNDLPGSARSVAAIGISVDPPQDTRARRRAFLAQHEMTGRMRFLNGGLSQLRRIWRGYAMAPVQGNVSHSAFVLLIDRHGMERVGFPAGQLRPEDLAHDIARLQRGRA